MTQVASVPIPVFSPNGQTLSAGLSDAQKFTATMGFSGMAPTAEPLAGSTLILKYGGHGGSHFMQSIPGLFIINADLSPAVHYPLRAGVWPLRVGNRVIEPNPAFPGDFSKGLSVELSWERVMEQRDKLVSLAKEGKQRPAGVGIDTYDSAFKLIQQWMCKQAQVEAFSELPLKAWDQAYTQFWDRLYWPLVWAGYPVVIAVQLFDEPYQSDGGGGGRFITKIRENSTIISEKMFKYLHAQCNVAAKIDYCEEPKGLVKQPDGSTKFDSTPVRKRVMRFYSPDPDLKNMLKTRTGLPDVLDISGNDPWQKYATAYTSAANKDVENAKSA